MRASSSANTPFDKVHRFYDAYMHIFGFYRQKLIARLMNLKGDEIVVDLGGGTGQVSRYLAPMGGKVYVLDESLGMLSHIRGQDSVKLLHGDALDTPFPRAFFDIAVCSDLLHHVADLKGLLKEVYRILKPRGRLLVYDFDIDYFRTKLSRWFEQKLFGKVYFRRRVEVESTLKNLGFSRRDEIIRDYWYIIVWRKRDA